MKLLFYTSILFLLFSGCSSNPSKVSSMEDPLIVPCKITMPNKPNYPLQEASIEDSIYTKAKKALAEIELRKGYELELEAAAVSCK